MSDIFIMYGDDSREWAQEMQEQLTSEGYSCFDQDDKTTLGGSIFETVPRCTRECGVCLVALTTACLEDMLYMYKVDMALYSHISEICSLVVIKVESCRVPDALHTTCVLDVQEPDYFDYLLTQIAKGLERSRSGEVMTREDTFGSNERSKFLPTHFVPRDSDVQMILSKLFLGGSSSVGIIEGHQPTRDATVKETTGGKTSRDSLGIWGVGGLGKTVLARMVHTKAKRKYLMHTAWVVFGQNPYLVGIFEDLHYQLVGNRCSFCNQEAAQLWLKQWSQTKRVFIVLDDVWNPDHAEFFNVLGLRGRYLITTRDQRVLLQINSGIHELGRFQRHDSKRLLLQVANTSEEEIVKNKLETTVSGILEILNDIPLAIATVGASLRVVESESFQMTIWEDALSDLRDGGESTLEKLDKAFDLSFQALHPDLQNLFIHMALFPEDVEISSKVVSLVLSSKVGFCTINKEKVHRQIRQGLRQLKERSLLQFSREAEGVTYYLIHDHLLRFVKQKAQRAETNGLQVLHLSLLEAYRKHHRDNKDENRNQASLSDDDEEEEEEELEKGAERLETGQETCNFPWWEIDDDGYFFNHIAFHLTGAGLSPVFKGLLLNYQWLKAKIKHTGVPGLLADFDAFVKMNKISKPIKLLHGALLLNVESICQDQNLLGPHLVGSLGEVKNPDIQKFICETKSCLHSYGIPVFVPQIQCLTRPGRVLKKVFCRSFGAAILSATVRQSGVEFLTGSSPEAGSVRLGRMTTGESFCLGDDASCHTSLVTCLALDPHDRFIISASCDSSLKLWPLPDKIGSAIEGKVTTIGHHDEDVYCVAVTKDGLRAVSGSLDETIKIWNLETCQCTSTLPAGAVVRGVCVAANDSLIISCGADSSVVKWSLKTGNLIKRVRVGTGNMVYGITISSDESSLALACSDKTVRIVQLSSLEEEGKPFEGHVDDVICCCFSLDKKLLFSGDNAGLMIIWCVHSRAVLQEIYAHSAAIRTIMLTPDQQTIFSSSTDDCIKLWRNQHMKQTKQSLQGKDPGSIHRDMVTHLTISPSGRLAASVSRDKTIAILDVETYKLIESQSGHENCVKTVEFLPLQHSGGHDGLDQSEYELESTVVSGSKDGKVTVWNWRESSTYVLGSHPHSVECLCVSKSGSFVFSGSVDSFVLMWDPWKRLLVCKLSCGDRAGIHHLSLMSNGRRLSAGLRGSVVTWNIEPIVRKYQGCKLAGETTSETRHSVNLEMTVSPSAVLFEPEPIPLPIYALPMNEIFILANSPNNKLRVCRSKVRRENKLTAGHQKGDTITALYVSDDETMIFSGSLNGSVRISWRVGCKVTKALSSPWQGDSKSCTITAITALCAGRIVLAGCQNGEIWMWDCRHYGATSDDKTTRDSPEPYRIGVLDSAVNSLRHLSENMVVSSSKSKVNPVIQVWELSSLINRTEDDNPASGPAVPSAHLLKCHSGSIFDVVVVDKSHLVSSSDDGKLLMWTISHSSGGHGRVDCSTVFKSELYSIRCLAVTPCKQIILCATCQNYIEKWTIEEMECESRLPVKFNLKKLVVLPDNERFMCLYDDLSIEVRSLKGGDSLTEYQAFQSALGHFCTLFEYTAISEGVYCSVKVWDWNKGRVLYRVGAQSSPVVSAASPSHRSVPECKSLSIHKHSRRITALDWLGMSHVVTGSYDCHLKLWHLSKESADCVCQFVFEHTVTAVRAVTSKSIAVGLSDGNVYFLDILNLGT